MAHDLDFPQKHPRQVDNSGQWALSRRCVYDDSDYSVHFKLTQMFPRELSITNTAACACHTLQTLLRTM